MPAALLKKIQLALILPPVIRTFPMFPCVAMIFPIRNGATILPSVLICPLTATFPPRNLVFPTFPSTAMMFATLANDPITLPRMSRFAVSGSVAVTPVSCDPFPMKKGATTLPKEFICPLTATLPPRNLVFPTLPCTAIAFATFA